MSSGKWISKWRWRLLDDDPSLWKDVLDDKYGPSMSYSSMMVEGSWPWYSSCWWKDLMALEGEGDSVV